MVGPAEAGRRILVIHEIATPFGLAMTMSFLLLIYAMLYALCAMQHVSGGLMGFAQRFRKSEGFLHTDVPGMKWFYKKDH